MKYTDLHLYQTPSSLCKWYRIDILGIPGSDATNPIADLIFCEGGTWQCGLADHALYECLFLVASPAFLRVNLKRAEVINVLLASNAYLAAFASPMARTL